MGQGGHRVKSSVQDRLDHRLERAAAACASGGGRLTEIRRQVLGLIFASREPVGAYALLDRLKLERANAAPVTIYRALDFLQEHGLIHKVERLNAFIACAEEGDHHHHDHAVQFFICKTCGSVTETEDEGIAAAVGRAAAKIGFRPAHATVEVEGICRACATQG
jgi:Fur family transcriptional regulator, zinc uptake regulator